MKEEDLALQVVKYFENLGYEVYKEVLMFGSGSMRADIYCMKDNETVSIETKMGMGLKVIEQAYHWRLNANRSWIVVPYKHKADYRFALEICRDYGIGVMFYHEKRNYLDIKIDPVFNPDPNKPTLYAEQKDSIAGNANSDFVTPFKLTCKLLMDYVTAQNGKAPVKDTIQNIKHHYANENSANSCIAKMIKMKVKYLNGLDIIKEGKIYYYIIDEPTI